MSRVFHPNKLIPSGLTVEVAAVEANVVIISARTSSISAACPSCGNM